MASDRTGFHHLRLAASPGPRRLNRVTRALVCAVRFLKQVQHMLGTGGRPHRQKLVVGVGERPAATNAHEPRVTNRGKDHAATLRRKHVATATPQCVSCCVRKLNTPRAVIADLPRMLGLPYSEPMDRTSRKVIIVINSLFGLFFFVAGIVLLVQGRSVLLGSIYIPVGIMFLVVATLIYRRAPKL